MCDICRRKKKIFSFGDDDEDDVLLFSVQYQSLFISCCLSCGSSFIGMMLDWDWDSLTHKLKDWNVLLFLWDTLQQNFPIYLLFALQGMKEERFSWKLGQRISGFINDSLTLLFIGSDLKDLCVKNQSLMHSKVASTTSSLSFTFTCLMMMLIARLSRWERNWKKEEKPLIGPPSHPLTLSLTLTHRTFLESAFQTKLVGFMTLSPTFLAGCVSSLPSVHGMAY